MSIPTIKDTEAGRAKPRNRQDAFGARPFAIWSAATIAACALLFAGPPGGQGFASPQGAANALLEAARTNHIEAVLKVLGPSAREILVTSDPVADENVRNRFVEGASRKMQVVPDPRQSGRRIIQIGDADWPLPIPLVRINGKWYFDVDAGKNQILLRRIGDNELTAIGICQGFVEAQLDYADQDPLDSGRQQYALKFISSPGKRDGLYWQSSNPDDQSPIGDIVARALEEGYTNKTEPYHGYYFKILTAQGPHAGGGAMSYLDNGAMTKGFAAIAWPAEYKVTGVMTFLVNKTGIVYQKDLGPKTVQIASGMTEYDPDRTWTPVANSGAS